MDNRSKFLFVSLFLLYGALVALFFFTIVAGRALGLSTSQLVRDPAATHDFHPLTGALSHLAVFGWTTGGVLSLFAGMVLRFEGGSRRRSLFLTAAGMLSIVLMLDDLLLFHEALAPSWLGIPEAGVYLIMAATVVTFVVFFRSEILMSFPWMLGLAGSWFVASIALDLASSLPPLYEDFLKVVGIYTWSLYWGVVATDSMVRSGLILRAGDT